MPKKIMMLGGNYFQMTAVLAAKRLGYHVIDVDYLPGNPAHRYADEYYNISTIDKEKVLQKARELQIDGIVSYASDVSAPTAAFVAEAMGLPTNPYESVMIMTHKDLFRAFLRENGFPMPQGGGFTDYEEALSFFRKIKKPAMVKPIDASGSKGVNKVFTEEEFAAAYTEAMSYSISKHIIIEEFIQRVGYQIDGDAFMANGKIVFWGICDQHHDIECSLYAPIGHSYPPTQDPAISEKARALVRNGGNLITDAIAAATEIDLAEYTCMQAVGDDVSSLYQKEPVRCASSYILHSTKDGIFREVRIDPEIEKNVVKCGILVNPGEEVRKFRNGSFGLGAMVITFDDPEEMCVKIDNMNEYIHVITE